VPHEPDQKKTASAIRVLAHARGGFVIRVGEDAMRELMPVFEAAQSYSNGPAWGALIELIVATDPRVADYELDAEGLGWSPTREPLDRLRAILLEAAADPTRLVALIREGRAAGFGYGDL
jgi:hypothetical protein